MTGMSYSADNLYLAALYNTGKMNIAQNSGYNGTNSFGVDFDKAIGNSYLHDYQAYELVAQYFVMPKWQIGTAYNYGQFKGTQTTGHVQYANYLALNTTYFFNKNFQTYLSYNINFLNDKSASYASNPNTAKQNQVAIGATYYF
jgi:predicted porin